MNILFDKFPDTVCVNGEAYQIETDFREWIRFAKLVEDEDIPWQIKCRLLLQWYIDGISYHLQLVMQMARRLKWRRPCRITLQVSLQS